MDHDAIAVWVYEHTLFSLHRPPGPMAMLVGFVGTRAVRFVDSSDRVIVGTPPSESRVELRRGRPAEDTCMATARALANVALIFLQDTPPSAKDLDDLAAALVMPKAAVLRALKASGPRIEELTRIFVLPEEVVRRRMSALGIRLASGQFPSVRLLRTAG